MDINFYNWHDKIQYNHKYDKPKICVTTLERGNEAILLNLIALW